MSGLQEALKGTTVVGKEGEVSIDSLSDCELIGVYFSAHWCPPCRGFTPMLAECYKKIKENGKKFEVIFVSSDRDEASFKEYYDEMPWLAVAFEDRDRKGQMGDKYGVRGIPTLILLKPNGSIADGDGRGRVQGDPEGKEFPWGF